MARSAEETAVIIDTIYYDKYLAFGYPGFTMDTGALKNISGQSEITKEYLSELSNLLPKVDKALSLVNDSFYVHNLLELTYLPTLGNSKRYKYISKEEDNGSISVAREEIKKLSPEMLVSFLVYIYLSPNGRLKQGDYFILKSDLDKLLHCRDRSIPLFDYMDKFHKLLMVMKMWYCETDNPHYLVVGSECHRNHDTRCFHEDKFSKIFNRLLRCNQNDIQLH